MAPVTIPDAEPTEAILGLLLTHVPPAGVADSVVVVPGQILSVPLIVGSALTVTVVVAAHPMLGTK